MLKVYPHPIFTGYYYLKYPVHFNPKYLAQTDGKEGTFKLYTKALTGISPELAQESEDRVTEALTVQLDPTKLFPLYLLFANFGWSIELLKYAVMTSLKCIGTTNMALHEYEVSVVESLRSNPDLDKEYSNLLTAIGKLDNGTLMWIASYLFRIIDCDALSKTIESGDESMPIISSGDKVAIFNFQGSNKWDVLRLEYNTYGIKVPTKTKPYVNVSLSSKTLYTKVDDRFVVLDGLMPNVSVVGKEIIVSYDHISESSLEGLVILIDHELGGTFKSTSATIHNGLAKFTITSDRTPYKFKVHDAEKWLETCIYSEETTLPLWKIK